MVLTDKVLAAMITSSDVRVRDVGVICKWMHDHLGFTGIGDETDLADELVKAQAAAGLVTCIRTDLDAYIAESIQHGAVDAGL
jgi:hypothetical protein